MRVWILHFRGVLLVKDRDRTLDRAHVVPEHSLRLAGILCLLLTRGASLRSNSGLTMRSDR